MSQYAYWTSDESEDAPLDVPVPAGNADDDEHSYTTDDDGKKIDWEDAFSQSILKSERFGVEITLDDIEGLEKFEVTASIPAPPTPEETVPESYADQKVMRKKWAIIDESDVSNFDVEYPREERAMIHPFELDDFQKRAVRRVEQRHHTVVAAHTSAGKTACAEYAIAKAAKAGYRVIYTSPIKALSNQKFREFTKVFASVGIITGDTQVNPDAQCLIITTEILRTLLFRGDPILDEVGYVIFDEVHYINDLDRGLVWEECIILMPPQITMVMLSATASNVAEFAEWVGSAKSMEVYIIQTMYRPVPLIHTLRVDKKDINLVNQATGHFDSNEYRQHQESVKKKEREAAAKAKAKAKGKGKAKVPKPVQKPQGYWKEFQKTAASLQAFIRYLEKEDRLPAIIFAFSREKIMNFTEVMPNIDLLQSSQEKSKVHLFLSAVRDIVPPADVDLPQIQIVFDLLKRGIGIHHGGLLPVVKEAVEILFSRGLVKALFATETFAMGVNMPARSVIFTAISKHDGRSKRILLPSEYIQMAGRAGRRGKDTTGYVYILSNELPNSTDLIGMLRQNNDPLKSKFRLTMLGLLNLFLRSNSMRAEDLLAKSFGEAERARVYPMMKKQLTRANYMLKQIPEYFCTCEGARHYTNLFRNMLVQQRQIVRESGMGLSSFLSEGRVLLVDPSGSGLGLSPMYAVVLVQERNVMDASEFTGKLVVGMINRPYEEDGVKALLTPDEIQKMIDGKSGKPIVTHNTLLQTDAVEPFSYTIVSNFPSDNIIALIHETIGTPEELSELLRVLGNHSNKKDFNKEILDQLAIAQTVTPEDDGIFDYKQPVKVPNLTSYPCLDNNVIEKMNSLACKLKIKCSDKLTIMDPKYKLNMDNMSLSETIMRHTNDFNSLQECLAHTCQNIRQHMEIEMNHVKFSGLKDEAMNSIDDKSLKLFEDLTSKKRFLKQLGFISEKGNLTVKGRTSIELLTGDELIIPELLFDGLFNTCTPEEFAAVLSTFVAPRTSSVNNDEEVLAIPDSLREKLLLADDLNIDLGNRAMKQQCLVSEEGWEAIMNISMAPIAYHWACGMNFKTLVMNSGLDEGSTVRMMTRLDELIRKVGSAAKILNNDEVMKLCEIAESKIRRDIIFSPSLYLFKGTRSY